MKRIVILLTAALVMAAMIAVSAPNAFAIGYGWGAHDCYTGTYPSGGGPGCGYHWGQR